MTAARRFAPLSFLAVAVLAALPAAGQTILHAPEAGKVLPSSVFFDGQSAPTQLRNSAGLRLADGKLALAVLVDSSGYSGGIQQKFQGYLLTEAALSLGGHRLPVGAYGIGVVSDRLLVLDISGRELFSVPAARDAAMVRPVPLQVAAGASPNSFRLCFGRNCAEFHPAP